MDLDITKADIDNYRLALKKAEPYSLEEIFSGEETGGDYDRRRATYAKALLEHFGLSLTDENDYGQFEKE